MADLLQNVGFIFKPVLKMPRQVDAGEFENMFRAPGCGAGQTA